MTHLNHRHNVVPLYPKYMETQFAKKPAPQGWKHHAAGIMACACIFGATILLMAFIGAVITSLLIAGTFALVFVSVVGGIGWLIRRLP